MAKVQTDSQYLDPEFAAGNPFDPETEPQLYAKWNQDHPSQYTRNDSDTPTDWRGIGLTLAAGVAPFVAQGLAGGAAGGGGTQAGASSLDSAGFGGVPYGEGAGVGAGGAESAAAVPTLGAAAPTTSAGLASTLGPTSSLAAPSTLGIGAAGSANVAGGTAATAADMASTANIPSGLATAGAGAGGMSWGDFFKKYGSELATTGVSTYLKNRASNQAQAAQEKAGQEAIKVAQQQAAGQYRNLNSINKVYRDVYDTQVNNLSPYSSMGNSAAQTLGQMMGLNVSMPKAQTISTPDFTPPVTGPVGTLGGGPGGPGSGLTPGPLSMPGTGGPSQPTGPVSFGMPSMPGGGGKVRMMAPDGSIEDVDQAHVNHYQQLGARVVQ